VFHILEVGLQGSSDSEVFNWAQINRCILVTFDSDLADRRNLAAGFHCGIIRLRNKPTTIEQTRLALDRFLAQIDETDWNGALVVIGRLNIRISLPSEPGY
jgi:predicted nuclease of predicted toxin-antitoxin system